MKQALINYIQNGINDEIYTPENAVTPLLKYIPKNIVIWEATDYGESKITKVLKDNGWKVISTHKRDLNFLTDKPQFEYDMIITNPPYSLKNEFIKRCYELKKPFALLLPITALESLERGLMFRENGISVIVLDKRINFIKDKKGSWFNTSWFIHGVIKENTLIFEKVEE